jgi:protein-L-isoaspartate(D-aspartate) O-methyltransferase
VLGVELEPDLVELGTRHLDALDLPWASIHEAVPGVLGLPSAAPYHRILVSAMPRALPDELVAQLHSGGVMVVPVAGTMLRVAVSMRSVQVTRHGSYRFVPLR